MTMITNERQFRISRAQLKKLRSAVASFDIQEAAKRIGSPVLARAELEALLSQIDELAKQVHEYEVLKSGAVSNLKANSLSELPTLLIKTRIARGLSQRDLAKLLGFKEQQIQRYESGEYSAAKLQRLAEVAKALQLDINEVAEFNQASPSDKGAQPEEIDWERFPVKEMLRRGWFEGNTGTPAGTIAQARTLVGELFQRAGGKPRLALHRKRVRSGSAVDPYALLAWECRVLALARSSPTRSDYDPEKLDRAWFRRLVQQSRFRDGPVRGQKYVEAAGIAVVIEPHLSSTHLDGAALLGERGPVVGLTLRHDRIDNFWFVLLHELFHVKMHLRKGRVEDIFDDMEADADALEREVDVLASRALISDDSWEVSLARYLRTEDSVKTFAEECKISEAVVAGRIRNEADNYFILNDLVGQGEVRRLFPEVRFRP